MWKCKDLMKMTDAVKPAKTGANVELSSMSALPALQSLGLFLVQKAL